MSLPISELLQHPKRLQIEAIAESSVLKQSIRRVHHRWPDIEITRNEKDQESVLTEILGYVLNWDWRKVRMSLICEGARYLFSTKFITVDIFKPLRQFYLNELYSNNSPSFLTAMFKSYMESYQPGAEYTLALSQGLQQQANLLPSRWQQLIISFPTILDGNIAYVAISQKMAPMQQPYQELSELGLSSRSGVGLMHFVHKAYVDNVKEKLTEQRWVDALCEWLKPEGKQVLETGAEYAINALLSHWYSRQPDEQFSSMLTERLIDLYGDPRTRTGGVWGRVEEKARQVMIRWLTREDMLFFMDVVSAVEDSHMWAPRREFWMSLYKQGKVNAAWVAFSSEAYSRAVQIKTKNGKIREYNFGRQSSSYSSRRNTSLLIMQIGRCIVVEGSHSYKVHFFKDTAKNAPALFQRNYDCERIRCADDIYEAITHTPNSWQRKVLEILGYIS